MNIVLLLMILMIVGAIIAIETTNLLSSIVCIGAVGFLLSIVFLFLGAPDIAITQIIVEVLCLVILIRATISRDLTTVSGDREFFGLTVTIALLLAIAIVGIKVMDAFPPLGHPVMSRIAGTSASAYLADCMTKTGAPNAVAAIMLHFRLYDTIAQIGMLFFAIIGALAILRRPARKAMKETDKETDAV